MLRQPILCGFILVLISPRIPVAGASNQGDAFFTLLLHNSTVYDWNAAALENVTHLTLICGWTSLIPFEGNLSDYYSGPLSDGSGIVLNDVNATDILENTSTYDQLFSQAPFDQGCAVVYAASPSVWDRKNSILWSSPGKVSVYYNSGCRRRELRQWSNYCPASPCGTGTHTEHGQPIRETVTATVNGRPCSTNSSVHPGQEGVGAQSVQAAGVITCDIQSNESVADITVEHSCTSIILVTHKTLKCGWKLVCGVGGPSEGCQVPMKSPPVSCGNPPEQDGACSVGGGKDVGGAPAGAAFSFPCGCHRVPDPGNSCWNCATTAGASGGILSRDAYRLHLSLPANITVSGYYDGGENTVSGYLEVNSTPDVVAGLLFDDVFYSTTYLVPRHILYLKAGDAMNESPLKEYAFEDFYNVTEAQNDSGYYDFAVLDAFPLKLSGTKGSRMTVSGAEAEDNSYRFMFTTAGGLGNISLGVLTLSDILSAETLNTSCTSKTDCTDTQYPYCVNGFCVSLNVSGDRLFSIADSTRKRNESKLSTEVLGPLKQNNNLTVRFALTDRDLRGLAGRNVSVRLTNYGLAGDYVTDADGVFELNFTAKNENAVLVAKFPGDAGNRGATLTQTLAIAGITPGLLSMQSILGLTALLFFVLYAFRWHEGVPSFYDLIEDAKRVLR